VAIENATRAGERICYGTLREVADRIAGGDFTGPTLVIIGRVAAFCAESVTRREGADRVAA
jgi:siroheme synthase